MRYQPPATQPESVSGLVERVTFFNEENAFAVPKVKAKGRRDQVTVIGSLPSVIAGEWVTAEGRWVQDREFSLQFRAEMLNSTAPTTKEGIEKYLGSVLDEIIKLKSGPTQYRRQSAAKAFDLNRLLSQPALAPPTHTPLNEAVLSTLRSHSAKGCCRNSDPQHRALVALFTTRPQPTV